MRQDDVGAVREDVLVRKGLQRMTSVDDDFILREFTKSFAVLVDFESGMMVGADDPIGRHDR